MKEGFFSEKRTLRDCQKKLKEWGFTLAVDQIAVPLLRKVRGNVGGLKRELVDGDYLYFTQ